jgi:glycosyltransferase involved in cell wall biosynthesis
MKIAFWNAGFLRGFGGAELCTAELLNAMAMRGETCYMLSSKPDPGGSTGQIAELHSDVTVRGGSFQNPLNFKRNPLKFAFKCLQYSAAAVALFAWLARRRVDVVHLHFVGIDVVMLVLFRYLLGYRLVLTFHGMELELAESSAVSKWKNRFALKYADATSAVSRPLCQKLQSIGSATPVRFIPNALDSAKIIEKAERASCPAPVKGHFVFCGRFMAVKQVPRLIAAYARAVSMGCTRKLFLVGHGPEQAEVENAIQSHGLEERVIIVPAQPRENALRLIRDACCLVLNSSSETYPMVILEAMTLKSPVIAPEVGAIGEMITHRQTGLLFAVNDAEALAEAIVEIDRDVTAATAMGDKAGAAVQALADPDTVVQQYSELYGV